MRYFCMFLPFSRNKPILWLQHPVKMAATLSWKITNLENQQEVITVCLYLNTVHSAYFTIFRSHFTLFFCIVDMLPFSLLHLPLTHSLTVYQHIQQKAGSLDFGGESVGACLCIYTHGSNGLKTLSIFPQHPIVLWCHKDELTYIVTDPWPIHFQQENGSRTELWNVLQKEVVVHFAAICFAYCLWYCFLGMSAFFTTLHLNFGLWWSSP